MNNPEAILIATLGHEPQVITLALDALRERGETIRRLIVVHTDPKHEPIRAALSELAEEFYSPQRYNALMFSTETLTDANGPLPDVASPAQIEAAFEALYQLLRHYKRGGNRIHLCIAGGRKTMALFAFAVGQLLFDQDDHIWHLYSEDSLRLSRRLHAQPHERVTLIEVPFMRWSPLPGTLRSQNIGDNAQRALGFQQGALWHHSQSQKERFLQSLSPAEQTLINALLETGGDNKSLAARLHKSHKTIANQLANIYQKFAVFYEVETVTRAQVIALLSAEE